jgi:hypothetical protein
MARITGKNAGIYGVLAKTTISVAETMTDDGAHTVYTLTGKPYWNPNIPPVITKQVHGAGPFTVVSAALYTVDYISGKVTFLSANNADDVVKVNSIEYVTLQSIGDMFNWSLDLKLNTTDATAFQDTFATKLSAIRSWTASAQGYHVSSYWWDLFAGTGGATPEVYIVFYPDVAGSERFIGAGTVDAAFDVKKDSAVTEKITFNGTGAISRLTA